jgi:hypothetical protein
VIICIDGNFQHRCYSSVQDDPEVVEIDRTFFFVTTDDVEFAKQHVACQRSVNRPSNQQDSRVPTGLLDECEKSHHAARDHGDESTK